MPKDEAEKRIEAALLAFASLAADSRVRWVLGGSAGLALRGARLATAPRDLDIYADAASVPLLHDRLKSFALDGPVWDESGNYRSLLAHYGVADTPIELVGDFEVSARGSRYKTEVDGFLYEHGDVWPSGSEKPDRTGIRLVPLGHELIFNVLRKRSDRSLEAARLISADPAAHLPVLEQLIARQSLSAEALGELRRLTAAYANGPEGEGRHG